jgi:hypothetical protein
MAAPTSAAQLPAQTPNTSAPIAIANVTLVGGELLDGSGKPVTGSLQFFSYVTSAWRYLFGTFAQTSAQIDPNFSLTASAGYSQSQMQMLADQVALLSAQLGRGSGTS